MKAITSGEAYDDLFNRLVAEGRTGMELYEGLVLPDIADAADMLRPVYDRTGGVDGYVSLEVNPKLAYDTERTLEEARRLFKTLNRPNVLIKVPATDEGLPAVETLIGEGINVNVTLIFSLAMYDRVMDAYLNGLTKLNGAGGDVGKVGSVASFFVSRLDTLVDKLLTEKHPPYTDISDLLGTAAVIGATLLTEDPWAVTAAGTMAVVGHNWSMFIGFGGGIGLSTLAGALLGLSPQHTLGALVTLVLFWLALVKLLRVHRARSTILAMCVVGPLLWALGMPVSGVLLGLLGGVAVIIKTLPDRDRQY